MIATEQRTKENEDEAFVNGMRSTKRFLQLNKRSCNI